ncbi:hypothetical protein TVAG_051860 [Trichomonas vaginalis G3]|uniref:Uncharacterized protein n=1 Tax=Trichomonas vaginalis (strain ATCC PRA-98 / G3) TaxID=412133 RepID=A2FIJ3_TRIV3|nr:WD repeat-containing protein family [Trichomonas vaginalis G3]EAX95274.1 hypothetical protein TVAG_051860 [Trichomonas vaginalis G3]KAI5504613.1 WD repeat-containing protein family [Trichomonas vaginalis G3]|eukprot:XP_001308204.1 hypothetical protein [Trichomonas vaginalis G3]
MENRYNNTDQIIQRLTTLSAQAMESIVALRKEIYQLLQERSKMTIHLTQYQLDYQKMQEFYNRYKQIIPREIAQMNSMRYQNIQQEKRYTPPPQKHQTTPVKPEVKPTPIPVEQKPTQIESTKMSNSDFNWSFQSTGSKQYKISLKYYIDVGNIITSVQYDPTGKFIAFADNRNIQVIDTTKRAPYFVLEIPHPQGCCDFHTRILRFSPDGKLIAVSTSGSQIAIFSMETRSVIGILEGHTKNVSSLAFLHDGKTLISGGHDGNIIIWDTNTLKSVNKISHELQNGSNEHMIISIAVTAEDKFVAVGFMNKTIGIYEPTFKQPMRTFKAHDEFILSIIAAPQKSIICTTSHDYTAKIWNLHDTSKPLTTLTGHTSFVINSAFSPQINSHIALTGSKDETIRGWDYSTGEMLFVISPCSNTIFSVDHHCTEREFVSCSGGGMVCVWEYS